ncbi:MAG: hypothetical protein JWN06_226 [Propionibacteriaceae bacterium]|jgi:cytochrome oxidase assembly protein ShyY1|nr:hypothetical protein [Propionibacteriaceae bacterium]
MIRLKQALIVALGLAAAAVMVLLGTWQLDVYHSQGAEAARSRAAEPPIPLTEVAPAGSPVLDGYGRSVTFSGRYDPAEQLLIPIPERPGTFRVLSALEQPDGSVVPVIRGEVDRAVPPPPPVTPVDQVGILLPSEPDLPGSYPSGQIGSVRVPALAQQWPGPLVSGVVTLSPTDAASQGLTPSVVELPEGQGRLRNGAYALQWWVFAAFGLAFAIRMARDFGRADALNEVSEITTRNEENAT